MNKDPYYEREKNRYKDPIPSREFILERMKQSSGALTLKQISALFDLSASGRKDALSHRIKAMVRDGQLIINRSGKYNIGSIMSMIEGTLSYVKDQPMIVTKNGEEYLVDDQKNRGILPYDEVKARLVKRANNQVYGVIVERTHRRLNTLIGKIERQSKQTILLSPNKMIEVPIIVENDDLNIEEHTWVYARIKESKETKCLRVKITEIIGDDQSENLPDKIAANCYCLTRDVPADVSNELDKITGDISEIERVVREDWSLLPFITIDGDDSKDFDDAVCVCKDGEDGWLVYVAIADVSHYVKPGSAIDRYAFERSTSVYLSSKVYPMLPEKLSNDLCSLREGQERLVVGVCMKVDLKGRVRQTKAARAIIKSHMRCTYQQIEDMIAGQRDTPDWLTWPLRDLNDCVNVLTKAHIERGGLDFSSTQQKVAFDSKGLISKMGQYERLSSHIMIERLMVLANHAVAKLLASKFSAGMYRHHPQMTDESIMTLKKIAKNLGFPGVEDAFGYLNAIKVDKNDSGKQMTLMRLLPQAVYHAHETSHFGLGLDFYTHFTSPIRRYPDLVVHRLLLIAEGLDRSAVLSQKTLENWAKYTSKQERLADQASYDALDWYKCQLAGQHVGQTYEGVIVTVLSFGCFVKINELGIEGLVHVSVLPGDYYEYDETNQILIGRQTGVTFAQSQSLLVTISNVDMLRKCIDLLPKGLAISPDM